MVRSMEQAAKYANGSLDCHGDCRVTCPSGYYDGKACSTYGGSCTNGSSRLPVLAASPCCASGSRTPLFCCADDFGRLPLQDSTPRWRAGAAHSLVGVEGQKHSKESTLHLVLRLRGGMQIFVKTLTGNTITLDVEAFGAIEKNLLDSCGMLRVHA